MDLHPWRAWPECRLPTGEALRRAFSALRAGDVSPNLFCYTDGSYFPPGDRPGRSGWSFILLDPQRATAACVAGALPSWLLSPQDTPSAFQAECAALAFAHLCAALCFPERNVCFRSDCRAAIGVAQGCTNFRISGAAQALADTAFFRRSLASTPDVCEYVPGHAGEIFNEAADCLARQGAARLACTFASPAHTMTLCHWMAPHGASLQWAALAIRKAQGDATLPSLSQHLGHDRWHAGLSPEQLIQPFLPGHMSTPGATADCGPAPFLLRLNIVSYNTLSLGACLEDTDGGGAGAKGLATRPGRAALLAEQLHQSGATIAALQETRSPAGGSRVGHYIRLSGGAERGQFGTELWLHAGQPALQGGPPTDVRCSFSEENLVVLLAEPRRLFVQCVLHTIRLLVVALHAPHRSTERHVITEWWQQTQVLVQKHRRSSQVILAGDVNCAVGSRLSSAVGDCGAEWEDAPGEWWHRVHREAEAYLPCSFWECQVGPTPTYVQKRGHRECRIDMVGIPIAWATGAVRAWVDPSIHVALASLDHTATCVSVELWLTAPSRSHGKTRQRLKASTLCDPAHAAQLQAAVASIPAVPWEVSAHAHAAIVVGHLQTTLGALQQKAAPRPRHVYITEGTWRLQRTTVWWRRSLHRLKAHRRAQILAACLYAWREGTPSAAADDVLGLHQTPWMLRATLLEICHHYQLNRLCRRLRRACRDDRDVYVSSLAQQVAHSPTSEVFQALHRLLNHKRKKPYALEPLPQVCNPQGQVCRDPEEAKRCWRAHFGAMEGGHEVSLPALPRQLLRSAAAERDWTPPVEIRQVPRPTDFQRMMAATKTGKAPGPDQIPGKFLRGFAAPLGPALFPLLLKMALRGTESIGLKGGLAVKFWKGKGSQKDPASYRQILLLSRIAKCMHQAMRPALRELYVQTTPELQIGGKPGKSVVYGAHVVRSFLRWMRATHTACFVLYTDISSAFYSVARQLVAKSTAAGDSDGGISLDGIRLPAEDLALLRAHACDRSALRQAGATPWLEGLAARLTEGTWFLLQQDNVPVITTRGSRPGSSWADLLFAFVVSRVLAKRDELVRSSCPASAVPEVPWDNVLTLAPCDPSAGTLRVEDLVWADDLATLRVCSDITRLPAGIAADVGALSDAFSEHGFTLSVGPSKTAVMAQPSGAGSRRVRQQLFAHSGREGSIRAMREHAEPLTVPLVPTYRHLGVQHAVCGRMSAELAYRSGQARAAFQEGRRKVFKAPGVPLERKVFLLKATVLPKLLYGAGAWPPLAAKDYRVFAGTLWSMYRQVLCIPRDGDQHSSALTVLAILQLPGPAVTLHVQRLFYLGQLLRTGPPVLWALLRQDRPCAEAMRASVRWLFAWVHNTCTLPHPEEDWPSWAAFGREQPRKFKGLILRAQALEGRRCQVAAALDGLYKAACSLVQVPPNSPEQESKWEEACLPCGRLFSSRVSWSCHAQRVHGYRTHAYLLGTRKALPLCLGCGKTYSAIGRLRRHLVYSEACLLRWGTFHPDGPVPHSQHPQAPPLQVSGTTSGPPLLDFEPGISQQLLRALDESPREEEVLWSVLLEHIEPLAVLRATVTRWASLHVHDCFTQEAAQNLLLLLDPDLIGDTKHVRAPSAPCPADIAPSWPDLPSQPRRLQGELPPVDLAAPPPYLLSPFTPSCLPLRHAQAYASWLEQACFRLAVCLEGGAQAPTSIRCPGLEFGLGPAASWIKAIGGTFSQDGVHFG